MKSVKKKAAILIIIGIALYGFSLLNGFVWDDEAFIQQNPSISADANAITTQTYFRPVMARVYSTLYSLFGGEAFFYHLFQVTFHIAAAVLLFYLLKRFFRESIAFFLSLLFLVHPANVEAVCFASATQEVLFTFTGLLGLFLLVRSKNITAVTILSSTALCLTALLMKETGIVFFVIIFFYLLLFQRKNTNALQLFMAFGTIAVFAYVMARMTSGNMYVQSQGLFPIMRVSFITRMMNIPLIILYYLGLFFFPLKLGIAQHWVVHSLGIYSFFLPLFLEAILFLGGCLYVFKTKNKTFLFFFVWFLVGLLPHLQIVALNMTVAERWLYFPMIGILGMIGAHLSNINDFFVSFPRRQACTRKGESSRKLPFKNDRFIIILGIVIAVLFFSRSFLRTLDWRNGLALYGSSIARDSSFDLQNNMGVELFRVGKYEQAKKYFEESTRLAPYWWVNWNNLGASFEHEQNFAKARECYEKSIQNGDYILAYENLAKILVLRGVDKKKASEFMERSLRLFPGSETLQALQKYIQNESR